MAPPPARNARKKSIFPDNALSKTETDQDSRSDLTELTDHSPGNSVTSVNSVSSLLKEKLLVRILFFKALVLLLCT